MLALSQGGARGAFLRRLSDSDVPAPYGEKVEALLDAAEFDRPTLVIDLDRVEAQFRALSAGLGDAHIHYAVKANPHPAVLARLASLGCRFDAASRAEIALCLEAGAPAHHISFGNTVKKPGDIAWAHAVGVDLFAADSDEELAKIAALAPGARVFIRLLVEHSQADWPLSRKFGCAPEEAVRLMGVAREAGLRPAGLSFHVGSQTRAATMWGPTLDMVAEIWAEASEAGFTLDVLNIGGGFPAFYGDHVEGPEAYARGVIDEIRARFPQMPGYVMAEPGRGMVAEAGVIAAEVLLVSKKRPSDIARWVYLDIGKFSGLAETMDEAIRYQFETSADGAETGPCILAGPSCDSADVLYEKRPVQLPLALKAGDRIRILCCGAYTSSYSSVGFNGFPPLDVICV